MGNKSESLRGKIGEFAFGKNDREARRNVVIYSGVLLLSLAINVPVLAAISGVALAGVGLTAGVREVQGIVKRNAADFENSKRKG